MSSNTSDKRLGKSTFQALLLPESMLTVSAQSFRTVEYQGVLGMLSARMVLAERFVAAFREWSWQA